MKNNYIQEKRQSKRYLCDQFFLQISLKTLEGYLDVTAIDFNSEGMGLFSNDTIPESGDLSLSLHYDNPSLNYAFDSLPCTIVYCNLTEVGSHCGIRFNLKQLSQADRSALKAIERCLIEVDDPENRYHFLSDE